MGAGRPVRPVRLSTHQPTTAKRGLKAPRGNVQDGLSSPHPSSSPSVLQLRRAWAEEQGRQRGWKESGELADSLFSSPCCHLLLKGTPIPILGLRAEGLRLDGSLWPLQAFAPSQKAEQPVLGPGREKVSVLGGRPAGRGSSGPRFTPIWPQLKSQVLHSVFCVLTAVFLFQVVPKLGWEERGVFISSPKLLSFAN